MKFTIEMLHVPPASDEIEIPSVTGQIVIGDHIESFIASLTYWGFEAYRRQWKEGIQRILDGEPRSCLITEMYDPLKTDYIVWWPMYQFGEAVILQNRVLFLDTLSTLFDEMDPYKHIPARVGMDQEEEEKAEWMISISELKAFQETVLRDVDLPGRRIAAWR